MISIRIDTSVRLSANQQAFEAHANHALIEHSTDISTNKHRKYGYKPRLAKRLQHLNEIYGNIVGCNMLRAFGHHVATCWALLAQI